MLLYYAQQVFHLIMHSLVGPLQGIEAYVRCISISHSEQGCFSVQVRNVSLSASSQYC